jgi:hypothetical protein
MKKKQLLLLVAAFALTFASCNKNECHECHYDKAGGEVELGEKCGDELEKLEANGYTDADGNKYDVHCHDH